MEVPGYELEALIGAGAMGEVWRARQVGRGDRVVALKRLTGASAARRARARREAEVLRSLDHPHIVRVLELVDDGPCVALAMQYAAGGSLADRLGSGTRLSPAEVVAVAAPVADALASAHRQGVLHRDVKPANILFTCDGEPLLSDFGVARWAAAPALTGTGHGSVGTAEYLDPAVADGAVADERSDVYALGVVCYEALAGRTPFTGESPLAVLRAADRGGHVPLLEAAPDVPPELAAVVERAMARRPADRPASAAELAAALRAAGGHPERSLPRAGRPAAALPPPAAAAGARLTRSFGPRPPRPDPPTRPAVPRLEVAVAAAVLLLAPAVAVLGVRPPGRTVGAEPPAVRFVPARPAGPSCGPPVAGPDVVLGDLDGDGCAAGVLWQGTVAAVPDGARYQLGEPGDRLVLGDWDCDGRDTPGLYRPASGEVFLFDGWASPGRDVVGRTGLGGPPGGTPRVVASGPGACETVEVRPALEPV